MKLHKLDSKRVEISLRYGCQRVRRVVQLRDLAEWLLATRNLPLAESMRGRVGPKGPIALGDFAREHYATYHKIAAPKSWEGDAGQIKNLVGRFGSRPVHEICALDFQELVRALQQKGRRPATINRDCRRLSNILRAAQETGFIGAEVRLPAFKQLREDNLRDRILSDTEEALLLARARDPVLHAALRLALHTGMRRSELVAMRWSHIDRERSCAYLPVTKAGRPRTVPLSRAALAVLSELPLPMQDAPVIEGRRADGSAHPSFLSHGFKRAAEAAGLEGLRFHDLRRTFITRALRAGIPEEAVRRIVGHQTAAMIARYSVFDLDFMLRSVEKMASAAPESGQSDGKSGHKSGQLSEVGNCKSLGPRSSTG